MGPLRIIFVLATLTVASFASDLAPLLPTPLPSEAATTNKIEESTTTEKLPNAPKNDTEEVTKQGRAMDISSTDVHSLVNSIHSNVTGGKVDDRPSSTKNYINTDLSDVSMDDDMDLEFSGNVAEKDNASSLNVYGETRVVNKPHIHAEDKSFMPLLIPSISSPKDVIETSCIDSGKIYKVGEMIDRGCDEKCKCGSGGRLECEPRCSVPYFRRGRISDDPHCKAKPVEDPCCVILVCAADIQNDTCTSGNKTYNVGEKFDEGCVKSCKCEEKGKITCEPIMCPVLEHREGCLNVTDTNNPCCMIQLCDVTQDNEEFTTFKNRVEKSDDHLINSETTTFKTITTIQPNIVLNESTIKNSVAEPIMSIDILNNGSVEVFLKHENTSISPVHLELSKDGGISWSSIQLQNTLLKGLEDGGDFLIRSTETKRIFPVSVSKRAEISKDNNLGCMHKGRHRSIDEEFHMGCDELCICGADGKVECAPLKCPSSVGLDVLDPTCIEWKPDPLDFEPKYPMCCPPAMKCVNNGSCVYKEHTLPNWSQIPVELTGCEQQCFCDNGMVECQSVCAPLPALPPPTLQCKQNEHPAPIHPKDDNCCKEWSCVPAGNGKSSSPSSKNITDNDKDGLKYFVKQNKTDKNDLLPPPIFVTLPPDLHKAIENKFGTPLFVENDSKKVNSNEPKYPYSEGNKPSSFMPPSVRPAKLNYDEIKHYEYPGPFADPNHKPQSPVNDLGPFPFIKKHKEKQIYSHGSENPRDSMHYPNNVVTKHKDSSKKVSAQNEPSVNISNKITKPPENHENFPINDPYLSGNRFHLPFNQNSVGPGFFNPATSKSQSELINSIRNPNSNTNNINPQLIQPGNGIYHPGIPIGDQVPQGPDTIHVYTDGSPIHIEHLLQHIQQADPNLGPYIPYVTQPQQPLISNLRQPANDSNTSNNIPPGTGAFPGSQLGPSFGRGGNDEELHIIALDAISPDTIRLVFNIPSIMIGLQGRVKLLYRNENDLGRWHEQEFAPPNDILATQQFEFQLSFLQPDTIYQVQAVLTIKQLQNERKSKVYNVRTLPLQEKSTLPPMIPIEPNLSVGQVNPTSASINWRPFTQDELLFIDGIQLRYREIDGKVYSGTPLIHRAVTTFQLESLKPNTTYEVGIFFIPFLNQHTELQSANMIHFKTLPETDIFDWNVDIDVEDITPWGLTITWTGIPRPTERFVNVFRAVWRAEAARNDTSSFSLPARESPSQSVVSGLTPGTKYRIWLELYLTNGRIKTSNVKDVMTKPGKPAPEAIPAHEGKLLDSPHRGDYYNSLVVVAIIAALGAMCSLVLLLVLVRRHRTASAPICGPTPAARTNPALPPYDSPTYKLDLHQETMDL